MNSLCLKDVSSCCDVSIQSKIEFYCGWSIRRKTRCVCTLRTCRLHNRFPNSRFLLDIAGCHGSSSEDHRYHPVDTKRVRLSPKWCELYINCYSTRVLPWSCGTNEMIHDATRGSSAEILSAILLRFDLKWNFLQRFRPGPTWKQTKGSRWLMQSNNLSWDYLGAFTVSNVSPTDSHGFFSIVIDTYVVVETYRW